MYYLSHPATAFIQPEDTDYQQPDETVYRLRLNGCAWILLYQCLLVALPALKLLHLTKISQWSWLWVTVPIWAPSALLALILALEWVTDRGKPTSRK